MNAKPKQPVDYRAKLRRFNLLGALLFTDGYTVAERVAMRAERRELEAELEAAELALDVAQAGAL